jgi:hypothetical protein
MTLSPRIRIRNLNTAPWFKSRATIDTDDPTGMTSSRGKFTTGLKNNRYETTDNARTTAHNRHNANPASGRFRGVATLLRTFGAPPRFAAALFNGAIFRALADLTGRRFAAGLLFGAIFLTAGFLLIDSLLFGIIRLVVRRQKRRNIF